MGSHGHRTDFEQSPMRSTPDCSILTNPPTPTPGGTPTPTMPPFFVQELFHTNGNGDRLTSPFDLASGVLRLRVKHEGSGRIVVEILSEADGRSEVSVDHIGGYAGWRAHPVSEGPHRIKITARGKWFFSVSQPNWTRGVPPPYAGNGDDVVWPIELNSGITPFQMTHSGEGKFQVQLISADGFNTEIVADHFGPYERTVALQVAETSLVGLTPGVYGAAVQADGDWTLEVGD